MDQVEGVEQKTQSELSQALQQSRARQTASNQVAPEGKKAGATDEASVQDAIQKAEEMASAFDRNLSFEYQKKADLYQVSVIERDRGEDKVIRKIPPDEVVKFVAHVNEMLGALLDQEL